MEYIVSESITFVAKNPQKLFYDLTSKCIHDSFIKKTTKRKRGMKFKLIVEFLFNSGVDSFRYMRTLTEDVYQEEQWGPHRPLVETNYSNRIIVVEEHHEGTHQLFRLPLL